MKKRATLCLALFIALLVSPITEAQKGEVTPKSAEKTQATVQPAQTQNASAGANQASPGALDTLVQSITKLLTSWAFLLFVFLIAARQYVVRLAQDLTDGIRLKSLKIAGQEFQFTSYIESQVARTAHFSVPENLVAPGASLADSGGVEIDRILSKAMTSPIVTLDLEDGHGWWTTRLLALSVSAVELGSPKIIIFLATKENIQCRFVGWAEPQQILDALIRSRSEFGNFYRSAKAIFHQLSFALELQLITSVDDKVAAYQTALENGNFSPELRQLFQATNIETANVPTIANFGEKAWRITNPPSDPAASQTEEQEFFVIKREGDRLNFYLRPNKPLTTAAQRRQWIYLSDGEHGLTRLLMDHLQSLETSPETIRIDINLVDKLFTHCLHRTAVDLASSVEQQIAEVVLDASTPYIAVTRNDRYLGLIPTEQASRALVKQVFSQQFRKGGETSDRPA